MYDADTLPCRNEKLLQDPVRLRQISERIPAGRWGEPRDFAGPVVFLASAASQYVCGEVLVVDGVSQLFSLSFLFLFFSIFFYGAVIWRQKARWLVVVFANG